MSLLTIPIITKLVLDHIGGSKISPNMTYINIDGARLIVQGAGSGIGGVLGRIKSLASFVNKITKLVNNPLNISGALTQMASQLIQNPVGAVMTQIGHLAGNLTSQIEFATHLPGNVSNVLNHSISKLNGQLESYLTHTNILSGVVTDISQYSENLLNVHQITAMASGIPGVSDALRAPTTVISADIANSIHQFGFGHMVSEVNGVHHFDATTCLNGLGASSLTKGPAILNEVYNSVNPRESGGLSELFNNIVNSTDPSEQESLAAQFSFDVDKYYAIMASHMSEDIKNQANLQNTNQIINAIGTYLPDNTNKLSQLAFNIVATPELHKLNTDLQSSV